MDDRRLFALVGEILFGEHWKQPLANRLQVSDRNLRRWLKSGEFPDWIWSELAQLLSEHKATLESLNTELGKRDT